MSKGFSFALGSGALWGVLLVLPLWLTDFSASDITFGRFLVFSGFILIIVLLDRRDSLKYLAVGGIWNFQQIALFGNLFFYLALVASIMHIGAVPACILVGVLPVIGWRYAGSGFQPRKEFLPVLVLMSLALIFSVASQNEPLSYQAADPWLPGVMLLLVAGACWLYSSRLQSRMVRMHPEIDTSDYFLLTGILLIPGVLLMSLLVFSSDSVYGLFTSERSYERNRLFWTTMLGVAGSGTLLARLMWKQFVRRESGRPGHWHCFLKSIFGLLYVFLFEGRWPDILELLALVCFGLGVVMYCRQRSGNLCLKA